MMKATRDAYGEVLMELGREMPDIVVLDADLSASTKTSGFASVFPERFFDMGIAEANMMGVASGLAASGKIPVVSTFAVFASGRVFDQVRQSIAYPALGVKIVATHAGLTVGADGASHQCLDDIALMRSIPGMTVIVPADAQETKQAVLAAVSSPGPAYIRLGRSPVPSVFPQNKKFQIGKGTVLCAGFERDDFVGPEHLETSTPAIGVAFIAAGVMVNECLLASSMLGERGISSVVADFASVKPLDVELAVGLARSSRLLVTAEEHSVLGGLGGAVAEVVSGSCPRKILRIGTQDKFGQSGSPEELLREYGLDAASIVDRILLAI